MNRLVGVAAGIAFVAVLLAVPLAGASAQNPPTIDSGPASGAAINNTMPTFAFSSPTATEYYCSVDSPTTPTALCTSPFTTPSLPEGTHTFYVVASDTVDTSATTSSSFTVDTTAPILALTSATLDEPSYTGPVAVNYGATASDGTGSGIASFSCSPLSGSPFSLGSTPVTCNATDNAGNPASGSLTVTVTDTTPPPVPNITGGPTGPTTATAPSFTFSAAGAVGFKCSIDNPSPATPCDGGTFTTSSLGDAPHIFRVVAIDFAGNTSAAAQQAFTVDTTPPPVPAVTGPTGGANSFTFSSNGATSFKCGVGQPTPTTPCSSPFAVGAIPDGSYTFYVTAADELGNTSTAGTRPFTVDTTPPPVPDITSGPAGPTSDRTPSFAFSSSGAAAFKCSIDNLPPTAACNGGSFTAATLTDGTHIFYVTALDAVLNTSAAASRAFTVDATPPDTSISTSIPATIASTSLSIAFTAIGGPATFECKIDAGSFSACPSPFLATGLADGSHTFSVRATDSVGNTDPTPATASWAVDATPPALTGPGNLAVEANGPSGTAVSYAVTGSDGGLALLPNQITCSPPSGTTFPLGTTTVTCTASDAVGNIGSVSFSVTVADTTAPGINAPDASFTATSAAGIARTDPAIAAYLAGISGTDLVSAVTLTTTTPENLPIGPTTIVVTARDSSGNTSGKNVTLTVLALGTPAPPPDFTPPGTVQRATAKAGDRRIGLTWTNPAASDLASIKIVRSIVGEQGATTVFQGRATSFVDRGLRNGVAYRYVFTATDKVGNTSPSIVVTATPVALLLASPKPGAKVVGPPLLRWAPVPSARYFNVQLYRNGTKVLSAWPTIARLKLTRAWVYDKKAYKLKPGVYTWYVWPGVGERSAAVYGVLLGKSGFVVMNLRV